MTEKVNKAPDFIAYNVRGAGNDKAYWNRVGVAFMHGDGKGVDIRLSAIPVDGHVTLRERAEDFKNRQAEEQKQHQGRRRAYDRTSDME